MSIIKVVNTCTLYWRWRRKGEGGGGGRGRGVHVPNGPDYRWPVKLCSICFFGSASVFHIIQCTITPRHASLTLGEGGGSTGITRSNPGP